jgi:hypothetical protein
MRGARWLFRAALALAVLVHLPALAAPFLLDDIAQTSMAEGRYVAPRSAIDLYDYIDDQDRPALLDRGIIPWWTDPALVVRFFRPLSSVLLWADHHVFGPHPLWHHLHSLGWWAVATLGVHTLLRRVLRSRPAMLGTVAFALAPAHAVPLVWLANRDVLVSTALGCWALVAYVRWRDARQPRDAARSLVLFALAVLAGEYGLSFAGYVLAIELTRRRESWVRRALGLAVFLLPAAAYVTLHVALGYDARGAGFYRNPLHDFGTYAHGVPRRLAILLGAAWFGVDESWTASSGWALAALGLGTAGLLAVPVARVLRAAGDDDRRRILWMLAGSVLSLGPVLAVEASRRLLGVSMIGVCGVTGVLLDGAWFPAAPPPRRGLAELTGLVALALGFAQLVRAPIETVAVLRASTRGAQVVASRGAWLQEHVGGATRSTVVVLRADSSETALWGPLVLRDKAPDRWRVLSFASGRLLLLRTGARSIELVQSDRPIFNVGPDDLFRGAGSVQIGDSVELPGFKATVLQVDDQQRPKRVRFELDRDLDDASLQWITEGHEGFREEPPPPVGYGTPVLP